MQHIKTRFWTIHTEKKKKEFSNFPHAPKLRLITMRKWKTDMHAPYTPNEKLIYSPPLYAFFNSDIPMQSRVMREISPWRKKIRERERERIEVVGNEHVGPFLEVFSGERARNSGGWTNQFPRELQVCAINHRMRILRFVRGLATSKNRDFFPPLSSSSSPCISTELQSIERR